MRGFLQDYSRGAGCDVDGVDGSFGGVRGQDGVYV